MVFTCVVYKCLNRQREGISFFRFPQNKKQRNAWIKAVNRKGWVPNNCSRICSDHFVDGWHSDDPNDINYRPTLFSYKENVPTPSSEARLERCTKRNIYKEFNEATEIQTKRLKLHQQFSVETHSYCKSPEDHCNDLSTCASSSVDDKTCDKGVLCDIDPVIQENRQLKSELYKCKTEVELYRWSVDKIRGNDAKTRFYTGLPTFAIFMWLFNFLKAKASRMQYWSGSSQFKETDRQRSSQASLVLEDQLFSTLMRLRLGLLIQDIADRFHISCTTFSKYFITWVSLLHVELKTLNPFPSRATVNRTMPDSFKPKYESVRVILDCTEVYVQRSSSLLNQALTFSNYKHHNTLKFLIGITPSGVISFVSEAWGGRASDTHITLHSGLLDLLDENDCVMVDKGFLIEEALKKRKCKLAIPPFRGACAQFSTEQVFITQEIARLRIHVERAIGRVKNFHILDGVMPLTLAPLASQIFQVCSWLSNFDTPLVK